MTTADRSPGAVRRDGPSNGSFASRFMRRLLRVPTTECPLVVDPLPIELRPASDTRVFFLGRPPESRPSPPPGAPPPTAATNPPSASVTIDEEVKPGQTLGAAGARGPVPSPVAGKVTSVRSTPDVRGGKPGLAVLVEVASDSTPVAFLPLDPATAAPIALTDRIREAGVLTGAIAPRPLADALAANTDDTVIVVAADREPTISATAALWKERPDDAMLAVGLLARAHGARRSVLAIPAPLAPAAESAAPSSVEVLSLPAVYPESLPSMVARRAEANDALVVSLESALSALDAVREGKVPDDRVITVIGPDGEAVRNLRVPIGTRVAHILAHLGLELEDGDKIVAGGPMRGFALYSLDAATDATVHALMLVRARSIRRWTDDPCINCGSCIDVCPTNLQVQMLARYAEFGLFESTHELHLKHCIECGLCASVCRARRPLLQLLRLAKSELPSPAAPAPAIPQPAEVD